MKSGRSKKLTGAIGEFLVSAELCRRGLLATPFSGNVPHYDIIASNENGHHMVIQVKAIAKGDWQFDVAKYVEIKMDGNRQVLGRLTDEPYPNLYCVFVALGEDNTNDRYFIFKWKTLAEIISKNHEKYLNKHGGIRPRNPESTHCSVSISELQSYENNWEVILVEFD